MRIGFISASRIPSRTANAIEVMKVCQAFKQLGHNIHLWVPGPDPKANWSELSELFGLQQEFPITWIPSSSHLRRYDFSLKAVFRSKQWGAELHYVWPLQAAAIASSLGYRTILEVHDAPQGRFGPWLYKVFMRGSGAYRILPITDAIRAWLVKTYQFPLDPPFAVIAPSGVDIERYANQPNPKAARHELGWPERITVGYTGHLYPGRGMEVMINLCREHPNLNFIWAGGEPEAVHHWREIIETENLENLGLLGFIPNERLPLIQAACDILLLPHERQVSASSGGDIARFTSPMKLFEYLASGRAIIASDLPVLREVLSENLAVMVPPEDIPAWSAALRNLSTNPEMRTELGAAAQRSAEQYTWKYRAQKSIQ